MDNLTRYDIIRLEAQHDCCAAIIMGHQPHCFWASTLKVQAPRCVGCIFEGFEESRVAKFPAPHSCIQCDSDEKEDAQLNAEPAVM